MDESRSYHPWILIFAAVAAASVDVFSFARLGQVFTSAMSGNLVLLGYYIAGGSGRSALNSAVALGAFVLGCALAHAITRRRPLADTLTWLLALELGTLLLAGTLSYTVSFTTSDLRIRLIITVFALAMGVQAIIGNRLGVSTVVFTTTIIKIVQACTAALLRQRLGQPAALRRESATVLAFFASALLSGALLIIQWRWVPVIALGALGAAFVVHARQRPHGNLAAAAQSSSSATQFLKGAFPMNDPERPPRTTADESIGRPQEWREGRYQRPGEPEDQMVNDPEQTRAAPEDPMGGQTPPRRPGPLHTDTPPPPGEGPVTLDDYTDPKR